MTARDRATSAIAALPAVGLDALTTEAALLTRVDRKYVVPMDAAASLLHDLQRSVDARRRSRSRASASSRTARCTSTPPIC